MRSHVDAAPAPFWGAILLTPDPIGALMSFPSAGYAAGWLIGELPDPAPPEALQRLRETHELAKRFGWR